MTDARWPGWPFPSTDPRVVPQPAEQQEAQQDEPQEYVCRFCDGTGIAGIDRGERAMPLCGACGGTGTERTQP